MSRNLKAGNLACHWKIDLLLDRRILKSRKMWEIVQKPLHLQEKIRKNQLTLSQGQKKVRIFKVANIACLCKVHVEMIDGCLLSIESHGNNNTAMGSMM